MKLAAIHLKNYRLIADSTINLDTTGVATVLVGPNNSGKTSVAEALRAFLSGSAKAFTIDDFSVTTHKAFIAFEAAVLAGYDPQTTTLPELPFLRMDLRFSYSDALEDLSVAEDLLMDLDETVSEVVLRIDYCARDALQIAQDFTAHRGTDADATLMDFMRSKHKSLYELRYSKISVDGGEAQLIPPDKVSRLVTALIKVDFLPAQRHMEDQEASTHATRLSRLLHIHYEQRFKTTQPGNYAAVESAVTEHARALTEKYGEAFQELKDSLSLFGYPETPSLSIRAELSSESLFKDSTKVYYVAEPEQQLGFESPDAKGYELPERYNGLGFKNLIYMVLQFKGFRDALTAEGGVRPRVHLIIVEEPEAHLHPQMQTVFLQKAQAFVAPEGAPPSQLIITTHSPHITAASGLSAVRYFRRKGNRAAIKDLMTFKGKEISAGRTAAYEFVSKYLTTTRCDLFYADKAILIEGAVERLLLPRMIDAASKASADLTRSYLSIVEVGGAYAHIFKDFLKFLEIPTLIITDLDSVKAKRQKCPVAEGITTSNATLKAWLPGKIPLTEILASSKEDCTDGLIRAVFQVPEGDALPRARSFEEAFCYANADWLMTNKAKLGGTQDLFEFDDAPALMAAAYGIDFPKVDFAIDLMLADGWKTPRYIADGLAWLAEVRS